MSLSDIYKDVYISLGSRDLTRVNRGYDPSRQRNLGPGPPKAAIVSDKSRQLIGKLERLWKPSLTNVILKVNYFCGRLSVEHFLAMGTNLIMCDLMDYYTVDLWAQGIIDQIQRPCCISCLSTGAGDLMVCAG